MPRDTGLVDDAPDLSAPAFAEPIWIDCAEWEEQTIRTRDWVAPAYLLRGAVTAVIGPPGVSKSMLLLTYAVALALGEPLHRMVPVRRMKILYFNVEDDGDEQRRRLSAILRQFGARPRDVAGRIVRAGPIGVGALFKRDPDTNELQPTEALAALKNQIQLFQPDVLILDPLSELHGEEENANTEMREVIAEFRKLAKEFKLALVLVHHTRKGAVVPGDMDSARGASSISGAARIVLTVAGMTEEEARNFGMPPDSRKHYFRLDGAKSNYAALVDAEWFERCQYQLQNGSEDENGDGVAVPKPWSPPDSAVSLEARIAIEQAVERGSGMGPWSAKLSNDPRSIRRLLEQHGVRSTKAQKEAVSGLLAKGFIETEFKNGNRVKAKGLRSPCGLPDDTLWMDAVSP